MHHKEHGAQRDTYWDVVKAVLIFLVLLGHVVQFYIYRGGDRGDFWTDPLFKGIYLFHMPLFILISGYFAAKSVARRSWSCLPRYLQRLALPCLGMGIIKCLLAFFMQQHPISALHSGVLAPWFLLVVLECVVCYLIMQMKQNRWWHIATFIIPIPLAILVSELPVLSHLWPHSSHFTYLWPIFVLGAYLATHHFGYQSISWKWCGFLILFVVAFLLFHPHWYVYRQPLSFSISGILADMFRTFAAIAGCGAALWLIKYLYLFIGRFAIVRNIGQATLALYILQIHFFSYNHIVCSFIPAELNYGLAFGFTCILLAILYIFYLLTRKIPLVAALLYGEFSRTNR